LRRRRDFDNDRHTLHMGSEDRQQGCFSVIVGEINGDSRSPDIGGTMPAKFSVTKDKAGKFRFSLLAPNGQVVATSQGYATKAAALNGVASVRKNAAGAALDDTTARPAAVKVAAKKAPAKSVATKTAAAAKPAAKKTATKSVVRKATKPAAPAAKRTVKATPVAATKAVTKKAAARKTTTAPAAKRATAGKTAAPRTAATTRKAVVRKAAVRKTATPTPAVATKA
jgi:uncharacterized protein YegP (UPF0339 family)